jgi:C4-dicarboxylate-specific signal transduction histidine kinase
MKLKIGLFIILLIIVSAIVTLNIFFQQNYQAEMANQFNQQQLIIAKTVATSILNSLEHLTEETKALALLLAHRGVHADGIEEFITHSFAEIQEDIGIEMNLMDETGKMIYASKKGEVLHEGLSRIHEVSKRLESGEVGVIDRITDDRKLILVTPVKGEESWIGSISIDVDINDVSTKFLAPIKSGQRGYAWMMDNTGTLIYHPAQPDMIGKNIFKADDTCFQCHKSFKAEQQILGAKDVGYSSYVAPQGEDKLVAFSRVNLPQLNWIVCVSIPYSEVIASINNSMRLHSMLVITIFLATVIGAFIIIIINKERVKAETRARYMDKIKEHADELENIVQARTGELQSEKEKLDAIVSSIEAGICIFDEDLSLVWMNRVMQGWFPEGKKEQFTLDHIYRDSQVKEALCGAIVDNRFIQEVAYLAVGNKKGYFQVTSTPLHSHDDHCQILVLIQDITEMKKAEEQLMQSEKLTALARLSAGVAHEIGNPLTSISSYVQILNDMEADDFTKDALGTISKHIARIAAIVRQMSRFSKTKAEDVKLYNVRELINPTIDLVKYDRRTKKIDIQVDVPDDLPSIRVDGNQLMQVFMNLILNAADAMPDGGKLTVRGQRKNDSIEVAFEDTGHGIQQEQVDRIFDPFFTTKDRGTGLGLAVSYSIVKSFGGIITVRSSLDQGSIFLVRLPVGGVQSA